MVSVVRALNIKVPDRLPGALSTNNFICRRSGRAVWSCIGAIHTLYVVIFYSTIHVRPIGVVFLLLVACVLFARILSGQTQPAAALG